LSELIDIFHFIARQFHCNCTYFLGNLPYCHRAYLLRH